MICIVYCAQFLVFASTNEVIWSEDNETYIRYDQSQKLIFNLHKPALWITYYVFGQKYVLDHHHDPKGNKHGHYIKL